MSTGYMSVGEVAERVGVTVRSIQYYDQQGILSPSAKGSQNQRLYTPADVEKLYCILCLKYAGLSLSQIRVCLERGITRASAHQLFVDALHKTEDAFSELLSRYATLRSLSDDLADERPMHTAPTGADSLDWGYLASSIERFQGEGKYFWRLSCVYDEGADEVDEKDAGHVGFNKERVVTEWHGLIAEAVANMRRREPFDSPRSQDLARHYLRLREEDAHRPSGQSFLLLESAPVGHHADDASFGMMRQEMNEYLAALLERFFELHPEERRPLD